MSRRIFLGIDDDTALAQFGANPAIAVGLELIADCLHGRDDLGVISFAYRRIIVGGARQAHQTASFGDGKATGPVMTDVLALLGRGAFLKALWFPKIPSGRIRG